MIRTAQTLEVLPAVAEAASAGRIRVAHVNMFGYGLKYVDDQIIADSQSWLLDVAKTCEPNELFRVMKTLREAVFPDDLDKTLESGLRSDKGVRPHLSVLVDADTLAEHGGAPAQLAGYDPIGPQLLAFLSCGADMTPILTRKNPDFSQSRILTSAEPTASPP